MKKALSTEIILDATVEIIRQKGPDKATISNVGKSLGVSHAAIYRYFESKSALWSAVTKRWLVENSMSVKQILKSQLDPNEKLYELLIAYSNANYKMEKKDPQMYAKYMEVAMQSKPVINEYVNDTISDIKLVILEGIEKDVFEVENVDECAYAIYLGQSIFLHPTHFKITNRETSLTNVTKLQIKSLEKR